jgi:hypothetical protein
MIRARVLAEDSAVAAFELADGYVTQALYLRLRTVKLAGRVTKAQVGRGEKGRDLTDDVVERRLGVVPEWSPVGTTHNDLRFAVEALSGVLLTTYAGSLESVRVGCRNRARVSKPWTRSRRRHDSDMILQ